MDRFLTLIFSLSSLPPPFFSYPFPFFFSFFFPSSCWQERKRKEAAARKAEADRLAQEEKRQAELAKAKKEMERRVEYMKKFGV
jgi:hypothetical protein